MSKLNYDNLYSWMYELKFKLNSHLSSTNLAYKEICEGADYEYEPIPSLVGMSPDLVAQYQKLAYLFYKRIRQLTNLSRLLFLIDCSVLAIYRSSLTTQSQ